MFDATWVMSIISGIIMLGFGAWVVKSEKNAGLVNIVLGAIFLGYGLYLGFFFTGGFYIISLKIFVAPFLVIGYAIKAHKAAKTTSAARQRLAQGNWQAPPAPGQYPPGQWPAQGAPGQYPPGQYPPAQPWNGQYPPAQPTPWTSQFPQAGQPAAPAYAPAPQPTWQPSANAAPFTPPAPRTPPTLSSDDVLGR